MFKFIANTYKELFAWFIYITGSQVVSFIFSYLIVVLLQYLNVYSVILILQKLLTIKLLGFFHTQMVAVFIFLLVVSVANYVFLFRIWVKREIPKDMTNQGFAYIAVSIITGAIAFVVGH